MSNEHHVRVALYWDDDVMYESDTFRYSCSACAVVKLPLNIEYDWLVRNLHIRMKTNPSEIKLVILGRWSFSTVQGNAHYFEISIFGNESLQELMVASDMVCYMINLDLLEIDSAGTSSLPQVSEILRVSEIQARIEVDAYADTHVDDNSDSDAPNNAYQSDKISNSGDDNDYDQQPVIKVPQNIPFYRENIIFLYYLQDRPEVHASTHESEGVGCKIWLDGKVSDLKSR
ncbi:hypothetical protein T459_04491 [Capsicum annuum]|uniref:Uncharacterized protein n=1 Tax=Capsicum annuum TaxID=4072 RepID=A0A2G3A590_CAPAN|nr:hypothetical protein T459_04491 [Capsicum annuum]